MNMQVHHVVSDLSGETGMAIMRALVKGERDPKVLARFRDPRCKNSQEVIEKSLRGHYKAESMFTLTQALATYDHYQSQIEECDAQIRQQMEKFEDKSQGKKEPRAKREAKKNQYHFDVQGALWRSVGVNLMAIPGINTHTALTLLSEIGPSVTAFRSAKHFVSWLGLSPRNRVSGGKRLSGRTQSTANRIKIVLRTAVQRLDRTESALGAFLRRMKLRVGSAKAITAVARKVGVLVYHILSGKIEYDPEHALEFERQYREKYEQRLKKQAKKLGWRLVPIEDPLEAATP